MGESIGIVHSIHKSEETREERNRSTIAVGIEHFYKSKERSV